MATRFRLPASGTPPVSPAAQSYTHASITRINFPTSDATALAGSLYTADTSDHVGVAGDACSRQFVSDTMAAGIAFVTSDTVKYAIQCFEAHANNNLVLQLFVGVVDSTGATPQATLLSKSVDGLEMATSLTNRTSSHNLTGNYTTVLGDRLVVEISASGTPGPAAGGTQGHNFTIRYGSNGGSGDLPEDDSTTGTTFNGWVEFSRDITFQAVGGTRARFYTSLGVA